MMVCFDSHRAFAISSAGVMFTAVFYCSPPAFRSAALVTTVHVSAHAFIMSGFCVYQNNVWSAIYVVCLYPFSCSNCCFCVVKARRVSEFFPPLSISPFPLMTCARSSSIISASCDFFSSFCLSRLGH